MKLLALLIGLFVERLATQLFHLRQLRFLDHAIDAGLQRAARLASVPALFTIVALAVLLVLPVAVVRFALGDSLFGFPYLAFAIVALFFSLGPKDIGEDVEEYCQAIEDGDEDHIASTAKALTEDDVPADPMERIRRVEAAVCVQANNRLFAVVFWFVIFGPVGAWAYRVTDLVRRRAVFNALRHDSDEARRAVDAASSLHGLLAWIPARLTALGYAMVGSFDGALSAWRQPDEAPALTLQEHSERLLAKIGTGALSLQDRDGESQADRGVRGAIAANGLVHRQLFVWAAVIAAMTLYGSFL